MTTSAETRQAISDGIKEHYKTHSHPSKKLTPKVLGGGGGG